LKAKENLNCRKARGGGVGLADYDLAPFNDDSEEKAETRCLRKNTGDHMDRPVFFVGVFKN
jgi:hypothetical protein